MDVSEAKRKLRKYTTYQLHLAYMYRRTGMIQMPDPTGALDKMPKSQKKELLITAEEISKEIIRLQDIIEKQSAKKSVIETDENDLTAEEINLINRSLIMYEKHVRKAIDDLNKVNTLEMKKIKGNKSALLNYQKKEYRMSRLVRNKLKNVPVSGTFKKGR
ncbi:hypothetical protein [Breznakia pachnodae]|uniref:Uncharacterized protein n=1 Tax=Breznakia pachnodae TaxID=265178 RepID=A0ABU0E7N1_9FIRM|nr:hypothetical protein [Breznakia pachnodae]MDQ0362495.1 hypothetical protein [Breznakia pachnodae]